MKPNKDWQLLYKLGGIAPFITIFLYLCQLIFISWDNYPSNIEQWYTLFNSNKLLALFYLNSLDMISIGFLGIMYIALYVRLREDNKSLMSISLPFAFLGIAVFIVPRSILLSLNQLTQQFTRATSEIMKNEILIAGNTISTLGLPTFQTVGFFIICISSLLISIVILKTRIIPRIAGYIGILGFLLTLIDDIFVIILPELATLFMIMGGCFWILWWIITGVSLLKIHVE